MKRFVLLVLCFALLLTACGSAGNEQGEAVDYNQYLNCPGYYACTDSIAYICPDSQIYFLDTSADASVELLCSEAACMHNDPGECTSYLTTGSYSIYAWNNELYYLGLTSDLSALELYKMNLHGENRVRVTTLDLDTTSYFYTMRAGCGRFTINYTDTTINGDVTTLYLYSFEEPEADPIILFSNRAYVEEQSVPPEEVPKPYPVHLGEDWVLYSVQQGSIGAKKELLYAYQISTGGTKLLLEDGFLAGDDVAIKENRLYWYDQDGKLYQIDLDSGESVLLCEMSVGDRVYGVCDDQWLYILGGADPDQAELAIYDYEGNEVQRISCGELGCTLGFAFSSRDKVYFRDSGLLGSVEPVCYIKKADIARGSVKFYSIEP